MKKSKIGNNRSTTPKQSQFSSHQPRFPELNRIEESSQNSNLKESYIIERSQNQRNYHSLSKFKTPDTNNLASNDIKYRNSLKNNCDISISKENVDFTVFEERENYYCQQLEKLQRKLIHSTKKWKRTEKENEKLLKVIKELENEVTRNKKFLKLMKNEMESYHSENKVLIEDKKNLEDIVSRVSRSNLRSREGSYYSIKHKSRVGYSPLKSQF